MPKPVSLPEWASAGSNVVEPTEAKKDAGWVSGERPPAHYFNWWQKLVYDWMAHLDGQSFTFLITAEPNIRHAEATVQVSPALGTVANTPGWNYSAASGYRNPVAASGSLYVPISLKVGDRLKSVSAFVRDTTQRVNMKLWKQALYGAPSQVGSTQTTDVTTGNDQTLTVGSLTETVAADTSYYMEVISPSSDEASARYYGGEFVFDRVA